MWFLGQVVVTVVLLYAIGSQTFRSHTEKKYSFISVLLHFLVLLMGSGLVLSVITLFLVLLAGVVDAIFFPLPADVEAYGNLSKIIGRFPTGSFLMGVLIVILLSALVHFALRRKMKQKFSLLKLSEDEYEICEYFIQWVTIYLAVYQFFFDGLHKIFLRISNAQDVSQIFDVLLSPTNINLLLQPLLITTWIVVVMEKLRTRMRSQSLPDGHTGNQ